MTGMTQLTFLVCLVGLFQHTLSADVSDLVGTWSSKSNTVFTGPGFYDPVEELLIEPALPGIAYSFTDDGHWEEAIYQVSSNARNHSCASAVLIYQHGTFEQLGNGSLVLSPIAVDGRQLLSEPCVDNGDSVYSRYVQQETFKDFTVDIDSYNGRYRLQLYASDGSKFHPLYLAYQPPMMLPTEALNPTNDASETATSLRRRVKRSLETQQRTNAVKMSSVNYDFWWYVSIGLVSVGSLTVFMTQ